MSNITIINVGSGAGPTVESSVSQSTRNSEDYSKFLWTLVNILLISILAFAAVAIKFCIVGTAMLKNISDGFNRIVHLNTTEPGREDPNALDGIDVDASSSNSDTSDEAAMSMARTMWVSAQQLALASFQTVIETAGRGALWSITPDTGVDDVLPLSTRRAMD